MSKSGVKPALPERQYGALCYRVTQKGKLRFLMVTSRGIGRWIVPKGWPMRGRKPWETAQIEAWEEAGVRGSVKRNCLGSYEYHKWREDIEPLHCKVSLYPLEVTSLAEEFPEAGQRSREWMSAKEAADQVAERGLAEILASFHPKMLKSTVN